MTKNGSKKPEIALKSILAPYEKNFAKGKENVNSNVDDQDYVPDEENCDLDEEFEMSREATTSIPKKKARTREQPPRKNKKQPLCPSMAMDDFLVAQNQMDPSKVRQIQQDVQHLVQDQQRSKRPLSTVVPLESQGESVSAQVPKKKGRGPTNLFDVHARKWEDRVAIYCNDKGQAIGTEKARKELIRFLGTIAHDYNWAPLTYTNWKQVPNKEKILEFVNDVKKLIYACQ
uniref:Uncharacterized protein n=1 Tax=Chenopodium quinoa TaxID=63459 RepID=A0A803LVL4_CHEQI